MRDKLIRQKSARAGASDPGHFSFSHAAIFNTEYNREASKVDCFVGLIRLFIFQKELLKFRMRHY